METPKIHEWKLSDSSSQRALLLLPFGLESANGLGVWLHSAVGAPEDHLAEASAYAQRGFICLLPDAPYSRRRLEGASRGPDNSGAEARLWRQNAWELSSLVDRLQSTYPVDPERSFAVGFNLGGSQIARWLKDEKRIRRAIVAGAVPELSRFWLESTHPVAQNAREEWPTTLAGYAERTRELDLLESVRSLGGARLLFQFGLQDDWINSSAVNSLSERLRLGTWARHRVEWLHDVHEMKSRAAQRRRRHWLSMSMNEELGEEVQGRLLENWQTP
jgi:poly(3-hydroxybutyrate) depolymerase